MARILVVDDDEPIAALISDQLRRAGHEVTVAHDGETAVQQASLTIPELVVLDVMLPRKSGLEVCSVIRSSPVPQPLVIMLTARRSEADAVMGYEVGADDYIRKPFSVRELMARIDAMLRLAGRLDRERFDTRLDSRLSRGDFDVDLSRHVIRVCSVELSLTRKEFDLLVYLLRHLGRVVTREELLTEVWGYSHAGSARTVDSHVTRVRKKLEGAGGSGSCIKTIHGVGYRLDLVEAGP